MQVDICNATTTIQNANLTDSYNWLDLITCRGVSYERVLML